MSTAGTLLTLEEAGKDLVELGTAIAKGDITDAIEAARKLETILVAMIPVDQLKEFLRPEDRVDADLTADVYEAIKLEGKKP